MFTSFCHRRTVEKAGFTLVETLVAISILVIVIVGPISIAARSMQGAYFSNEQVTAVFLAQEGLESIKRLRDDQALRVFEDNQINDDSWAWYNALLASCRNENEGCDLEISPTSGASTYRNCGGGGNCQLRFNSTGGRSQDFVRYGYSTQSGWGPSPFTRVITVESVQGGAAVEVTSRVTWSSPLFSSGPREVVLRAWIYDHYQRYE
jgi:prepilin-type N-terminal cleavage/methylation domain-containing protein